MEFAEIIKNKYPYISDNDIDTIVLKAKTFYYGLKFPCEPYANETTHPISSYFNQNWIKLACEELISRLGFDSAIGYKENGVSWSFDNAYLSDRLVNLIKPKIGTIK